MEETGKGLKSVTGAKAAEEQAEAEAQRIKEESAKLKAAPHKSVDRARKLSREKAKRQKAQTTLLGGASTQEGGSTLLG